MNTSDLSALPSVVAPDGTSILLMSLLERNCAMASSVVDAGAVGD
jgi:hypothetical protein